MKKEKVKRKSVEHSGFIHMSSSGIYSEKKEEKKRRKIDTHVYTNKFHFDSGVPITNGTYHNIQFIASQLQDESRKISLVQLLAHTILVSDI